MPFNGAGVFQRLYSWAQDRANGIKINADRQDAELDGIAAGLSNCITKDGQTIITADIPMNGKRLTGLGTATAGTDAVSKAYVDGSTLLSGNGYQVFPTADSTRKLIIQWGTATTPASGFLPVFYPMTFPNACASLTVSPTNGNSTANTYSAITGGVAKDGFFLYTSSAGVGAVLSVNYVAIGC